MKKLLLLLFLVINVNAFAQTFFSSDSAGTKNIADLIIENTKNKYQLENVIARKENIEFRYRHGPRSLIRIHFQIFPDPGAKLFILKGLTGNYEDIFPFWKKYFQADADTTAIESTGNAKSAAFNFLTKEIVYSFSRLAKPLWQIKPHSLVDPIKK